MTDNDLDLVGLTRSPEREAKVSKRDCKFAKEILGEVKVRRMSTANREILWGQPATSMPEYPYVYESPPPEVQETIQKVEARVDNPGGCPT